MENFCHCPFFGGRRVGVGRVASLRRAGQMGQSRKSPLTQNAIAAHNEWISRLTDGLESIYYVYSRMSFLIELRHRRRPQLFALGAISVKFENASLY